MGGFLLGGRLQLLTAQPEISKTAILALHARNDTTIPPSGGVSDSGWLFEPLDQSTGIWATLHECEKTATAIKTPWDGGKERFACAEFMHCTSGRRVIQCMYDG